jgi:hypothetical protein
MKFYSRTAELSLSVIADDKSFSCSTSHRQAEPSDDRLTALPACHGLVIGENPEIRASRAVSSAPQLARSSARFHPPSQIMSTRRAQGVV